MYSWPLNNAGLHCVCLCVSCSVVSDSATPWTLAHQVLLSMKFSRQEYWSGLSFPSLGNLPDSGIKLQPPALQAESLPSEPPGSGSTYMQVFATRMYYPVPQDLWLSKSKDAEPWIQRLNGSHTWIFNCTRASALNYHVVQGSAVYHN